MTYPQRLWFATLLTALALVSLAASAGCSRAYLSGDVPSTMDPAVARLVKVVDGETAGYCTVFKVGRNLAMTAGHCCGSQEALPELDGIDITPPEETITYHAEGPHAIPGAEFKVLHDDDVNDVCVLRGKLQGAPMSIAPFDPPVGARVWTAGYPKTHLLFSDGLWSGREDDHAKASIAVWGGASGSPVLDQSGRVIGILVAFYPPMSNFSLIAPIEWLRAGLAFASADR